VGLVDREALLKLGRAVDLARDQQRTVEKERGLPPFHDLEAGALERRFARRWRAWSGPRVRGEEGAYAGVGVPVELGAGGRVILAEEHRPVERDRHDEPVEVCGGELRVVNL
jgi:hypothetical protein